MTTTTPTYPDLPAPAGARPDDWQDDWPLPYRVLFGERRGIDGVDVDRVGVAPSAIQLSDGRIDDGSLCGQPHVHPRDDTLPPKQARDRAAALIAAADELDRLVAKGG